MDRYVDMSKLGALCVLVVEFIPIFIYTFKCGLEAVRMTLTDPTEGFRENSTNSTATADGLIRGFKGSFFHTSSDTPGPEDNVMLLIALQVLFWFIFLFLLVYYFIPQIRALRGLLRKKPSLMRCYFRSKIVQIQLWIILSMLTGLTFLNVLFNKSYVVAALIKFHGKKQGTAQNEKDLDMFQNIEKVLFSVLVVLVMVTYLEYYCMSVVKLYYLRLKREGTETPSEDSSRKYQRIAEDVV